MTEDKNDNDALDEVVRYGQLRQAIRAEVRAIAREEIQAILNEELKKAIEREEKSFPRLSDEQRMELWRRQEQIVKRNGGDICKTCGKIIRVTDSVVVSQEKKYGILCTCPENQ